MRRRLFYAALAMQPLCVVQAQTRPLVDHHQHLFSPATAALVSPKPPAATDLPSELLALLEARSRDARDASRLRDLYTDDAVLQHFSEPGWIRGRDSVVAQWVRSTRAPFRLTPVAWSVVESGGHVTAYLTEGSGDTTRHVAHVLLSIRRGSDARWRIAAEAVTRGPTSIDPISASELVALLDAAGIRRALVLSMGYTWGSPNRRVENEYEKVKAENDWTSQQVARFPDRLRAFCSFNPLRDYALVELARCAKDPRLRHGLKLHFANSVVDLHNPQHVEQLRRVFRGANDHRMPIVVHLRSSLSRRLPYGRDEARIFLNDVLPAAPDVPVQIAHLAGAGGYDDPTTDEALAVLADAVSSRDPRTKRLYFDVTTAVGPGLGLPVEQANLIARRIRQIGVDRILFGSDAAVAPNVPPREAWAAFRQLPLTDAEFRTIATNVAPYMR
jgi:predicted TIM-barrel fold metal-dependent hydrolase